MPRDYIPQSDSEILEFADNFITKTTGSELMYGLTTIDTTSLTNLRNAAQTAYDDNLDKQNAARTALELKKMQFEPLVIKLRQLAQRVQVNPGTDDMMREGLGITIRDTSQTSVGIPETRPMAMIDTSVPLRHTIN